MQMTRSERARKERVWGSPQEPVSPQKMWGTFAGHPYNLVHCQGRVERALPAHLYIQQAYRRGQQEI
jgi:hypothetical protein